MFYFSARHLGLMKHKETVYECAFILSLADEFIHVLQQPIPPGILLVMSRSGGVSIFGRVA